MTLLEKLRLAGVLRGRGAGANFVGEGIDAGGIAVPGEHEACGAADEGVEAPAAGAKLAKNLLRSQKKNRVGFDGLSEMDAGNSIDFGGELACATIGMLGVA